jgi:PAS domain S-box-containing protein
MLLVVKSYSILLKRLVYRSREAVDGMRILVVATLLVPSLLFMAVAREVYVGERSRANSAAVNELGEAREHASRVFRAEKLVAGIIEDDLLHFSADRGGIRLLHDDMAQITADLPQIAVINVISATGLRTSSISTAAPGGSAEVHTDGELTLHSKLSGVNGAFMDSVDVIPRDSYLRDFYQHVLAKEPGASILLVRMDGRILLSVPTNTGSTPMLPISVPACRSPGETAAGCGDNFSLADHGRLFYFARVLGSSIYVVYERGSPVAFSAWLTAMLHYCLAFAPAVIAALILGIVAVRRAARGSADHIAVREREHRFRTLYDLTPVPILILDEKGMIVDVSERWLTTFGYTRGDVINQPEARFASGTTVVSHQKQWPELLEQGFYTDQPWTYLSKNGAQVPTLASAVVERNAEGRVVRIIKAALDMTGQTRAEAALRHSQKMEALGKLTGGVAHDFNNILAVVSGNAELAVRKQQEGASPTKQLANIIVAAERATGLTRQLLSFSRKNPMTPKVIDLKAALPQIMNMLGPSLRGDINVLTDVSRDVWTVEIDLAEFEIAVLNVSVNARDALPEGGQFIISVRNKMVTKGQIAQRPDLEGAFVEICLNNNGASIESDVADRAFEPFYTTKGLGRGTGLGLSQVYGFAQQSGGTAEIRAAEVGTDVVIYLPKSLKPLEAVTPETLPDLSFGRGHRVLVVDDNVDVGTITSEVLESAGYETIYFDRPQEALAHLDEKGHTIHMVLSDIVMPGGMNGVEMARRIRRSHPSVPIVLMSGYSDDAVTSAEFVRISKPFRMHDLMQAVSKAIKSSTFASV